MPNEPVGVLIIGAGASAGAFAWSIAAAGMSVLCLEQGPWMKQSDYPTNNLDWESRAATEFSPNPNIRCQATEYPSSGRHPDQAAHLQGRRPQHHPLSRQALHPARLPLARSEATPGSPSPPSPSCNR